MAGQGVCRSDRLMLAWSCPSGAPSRLLAASAALIAVNWFVYIWSVANAHLVEASLGYFINPLVNVALGTMLLGERLDRLQGAAIGVAGVGVLILAASGGGVIWISLTLALSFGFYGLIRKVAAIDALGGLTIETALLAPLALGWLAVAHLHLLPGQDQPAAFGWDLATTLLLILSGPITAIPLMLFARASRSVDMATVGLIGYLNPTLQFLCAVLLFGEVFTRWHAIAFAMIWSALGLYTLSAFRAVHARNRNLRAGVGG